MATDKVRVKPVRVTRHDDDLAVDRSRVVGFRGVSTSGWSGPVRVVRQDAVRDVQEYRAGLTPPAAKPSDAPTMTRPGTTGSAQ